MSGFKKPSSEELKKKLTPQQYFCTQEAGTERPFENEYWDNKADGIYVDVVSGEPLFSSINKYDSGTGWPSFDRPLVSQNILERRDTSHGMERVEVVSAGAGSHLGHVFPDGPVETTGLRFCINSAALRFIPAERMLEEGYGEFLFPFAKKVGLGLATLAGGCFWGVEDLLRQLLGVLETQVGYTGGDLKNATYEQVKKGNTNHAEAVQILFDPNKITYEEILKHFFRLHDPTTLNQQGNDRGTQYRSAIFYSDEQQKAIAEKVIGEVTASGFWEKPIVTQIVPLGEFWRAEEYHQKYLMKNPGGYTCHYYR